MKANSQDPDEFERILQRQTLRRIPWAWRSEVLGAAEGTRQALAGAEARLENSIWRKLWLGFRSVAATLFRPSPAGWGTLAAVWVVLFLVNHQVAGPTHPPVAGAMHVPADISGAWKEQEQLLTELLGSRKGSGVAPDSALPAGHFRGRSADHSLLELPKMTQYRV